MNGENGNCFCFLNGGKNVLYRKKEKEVFVMFIYKKNCFKIIKIGIFFFKIYEVDVKRVVVLGKDYFCCL